MPQIALDPALLASLLEDWRLRLMAWAQSGALSRAAMEALRLPEEPETLKQLVGRWGVGDWGDLPQVEVLPASAMPTAAGAYAIPTGTIYLNQAWLQGATRDAALAVLTEELGHHLDGLLNASDTPGDEGELLAALLINGGTIGEQERQVLLAENDQGSVWMVGKEISVEQAGRVVSTPMRELSVYGSSGEVKNMFAFAALKDDGSVVTWGSSSDGGDSSSVATRLSSGVSQIFSSGSAFAALKVDGSVVTWGDPLAGGDSDNVADKLASGVVSIFSNGDSEGAFAALKADGSVVTWGESSAGGDSSAVSARLASGVTQIFSTGLAFAALKSDGSVVTWGVSWAGGDSSAVSARLTSGVTQIFSTGSAFAALKSDGSVVTWGESYAGGDSSAVSERLASGVVRIIPNSEAFAALKVDGSVVTWGDSISGGNSNAVAARLGSGVAHIFSTREAFAALKEDGSVVTWGSSAFGGNSNAVTARLASGVIHVFSAYSAFAALKDDGSVVTWGSSSNGGDSSSVATRLSSGVAQIFSNVGGFAALKQDGSVVTWGSSSAAASRIVEASRLSSGVTQIFSNAVAFAALKQDGSVVTWGDSFGGADSSMVVNRLRDNVIAFANPFTDDRLVFDSPASIDLSLSLPSVREDSLANLVYIFTRSGTATNALTVGFNIGGSASFFDGDYSQQGASSYTGTSGFITFAAGANTATLTIDPTADPAAELDETVILSLAQGVGYTVGPQNSATGTILNDDTVIEVRGTTSLLRRGDDQAFVQVGIGPRLQVTSSWGAAVGSNSSPWQILAADTVNGVNQILWRNNSANFLHTWSLDANWNWTSSGGTFDPNASAGWSLETSFQVDANNDGIIGAPLSTIEARGTTTLLRRPSDDQAFVQVGSGLQTRVTSPWGATVGSNTSPWQMLAADTVNGVNQILWRNNSANFLHTWSLDATWTWTSSGGTFALNETSGWNLESSFQVDANNDGIIGAPFSTIEARGTTSLLRRPSDDQAFVQVGSGLQTRVTSPWGATVGSNSSPWQMLAADTINGVNQILWRNNSANVLHTWSLDANWAWSSSGGTFDPNASAGWNLESSFQVDANNDGIIGAPFSTIEAMGNATLLSRGSDGRAFVQVGTGPRMKVTIPWNVAITTYISDTTIGSEYSYWQLLAAETIDGVNQLLWRNNVGKVLHTWSLDANWNWTSSGGTFALNEAPGWTLETSFQVDANNDGIIGAPFSTIEALGTTTLLSRPSDDQAFVQVGSGPRTQVQSPWGATIGSNTSPWQMLAADTVNGVNQVLWRNNSANFLHTWSLDSNWNWTASNGTDAPTSPQGIALLNQFGLG